MLNGFPVPGYIGLYETALTLAPMWEHVPKEDLAALEITGEGNFKFSFQKQFEAHYINKPLLIQDKEWAKVTFITIWEDNRWLIEKIKNYKEKIKTLISEDNWSSDITTRTGTKSTGDTTSSNANNTISNTDAKTEDKANDKNTLIGKNFGVTNTGQTDNNSQYDSQETLEKTPIAIGLEEALPEDLMKIEILANTLGQSKAFSGNTAENIFIKDNNTKLTNKTETTFTGVGTSKSDGLLLTYSNTIQNNNADDTVKILNLEIPQLRKKFLKKFLPMFKA